MKKLILTILLMVSASVQASGHVVEDCQEYDLTNLKNSYVAGSLELGKLIEETVLPNIKSCVVIKAVPHFPTVCDYEITERNRFRITTVNGYKYEISNSTTYRSCIEIFHFWQIDRFEMEKDL